MIEYKRYYLVLTPSVGNRLIICDFQTYPSEKWKQRVQIVYDPQKQSELRKFVFIA
jgi:hypothetical protein